MKDPHRATNTKPPLIRLIFITTILLWSSSCIAQAKGFQLIGRIRDAEGLQIYLATHQGIRIDSTLVVNSSFCFSGAVTEPDRRTSDSIVFGRHRQIAFGLSEESDRMALAESAGRSGD